MTIAFVIKWNKNDTYLKFKDGWYWVGEFTEADYFNSHEEAELFIQRPFFLDLQRVNSWNSSDHMIRPYSIIQIDLPSIQRTKFVVRWKSDHTYMCGESLNASKWRVSVTEAKQFSSKEEVETFLIHPVTGIRWWANNQISIDEINILNFKRYG